MVVTVEPDEMKALAAISRRKIANRLSLSRFTSWERSPLSATAQLSEKAIGFTVMIAVVH